VPRKPTGKLPASPTAEDRLEQLDCLRAAVDAALQFVRDIRALFPVAGRPWVFSAYPGRSAALSEVINSALALEQLLVPEDARLAKAYWLSKAANPKGLKDPPKNANPNANPGAFSDFLKGLVERGELEKPPADTSPARFVPEHVIGPGIAWRKLWPAVDALMCAYDAVIKHYGWSERVAGWPGPPAFGNLPETDPKLRTNPKVDDKDWARWVARWVADYPEAEIRRQKKSWGWAWPKVPPIRPALLDAVELSACYIAELIDPIIYRLQELLEPQECQKAVLWDKVAKARGRCAYDLVCDVSKTLKKAKNDFNAKCQQEGWPKVSSVPGIVHVAKDYAVREKKNPPPRRRSAE
jgi:hypothetical protein